MINSDFVKDALDRYEVPLLRYATSLLGDLERARDVVQETFLKLCEQRAAKVEQYLAQWLFTVCRNLILDKRRREGRMSVLTSDHTRSLKDKAPEPSILIERKEKLGLIDNLLSALSENQREVVRLKFQLGMSYKEISEITGLSVSNVGFQLHTAVKTMRERIKKDPPVRNRLRRVK